MNRWNPLVGALLTAVLLNLGGVSLRLEAPPALGLLVYAVLCLGLFDWAAQRMGSAPFEIS